MSYLSYWIMITTDMRSSCATAEDRVHINTLNLRIKNQTFDGKDLIRVLDFLARFVNEAVMLNMSEAQAFIALQTFFADTAETQFRTNLSGASVTEGLRAGRRPSSNSFALMQRHLLCVKSLTTYEK